MIEATAPPLSQEDFEKLGLFEYGRPAIDAIIERAVASVPSTKRVLVAGELSLRLAIGSQFHSLRQDFSCRTKRYAHRHSYGGFVTHGRRLSQCALTP